MKNLTHRWPQTGHFFSKIKAFFFQSFKKVRVDLPPPHPRLYLRAWLDKVYILAEGMYFLDKISPSNFNFLDFPCLSEAVQMRYFKPRVSFGKNLAPFCIYILAKTLVSVVNGISLKSLYKMYREASIFYFNTPFFWC